jgi:hypothetical protein
MDQKKRHLEAACLRVAVVTNPVNPVAGLEPALIRLALAWVMGGP